MDYWWIGYALAILAGVIFSVVGLVGRHRRDEALREQEEVSQS
jgi:hypothetical protein